MNSSNISECNNCSGHPPHESLSSETAAVCYAVIFVLALVGNILVIATLVQNKRMRTVTNVFLLNLSFSDLLLAVFCMPFNIIPMLMRNFVFGPTVCYLSRYFQGKFQNIFKKRESKRRRFFFRSWRNIKSLKNLVEDCYGNYYKNDLFTEVSRTANLLGSFHSQRPC